MAPTILVYVQPQQFSFENPKGDRFPLKTVMYLLEEQGRWKLGGIGTWEDRPPDALTVDLFENHRHLPDEVNKFELLAVFMSFGIGKCLHYSFLPPAILRPTVVFHQANLLSNILCGYEKVLLYSASERAGANKITFD